MTDQLDIKTPDGCFQAYVSMPASTPAPAVVIVQEIFGVNAGMRQIADALAGQGFIAVVPDIFWRLEPGLQLSDDKAEDVAKAMNLYGRYDIDNGVQDIAAVINAARALPGSNGKVGVTGFCLGGLMAFLTAARADPDAAVTYYGGRIDEFVGEGDQVVCPLLMHFAGSDDFIDADAQAKIADALGGKANVEIHVYPGRNHAFVRPGGANYNEHDATVAKERTRAFFTQHLA